MIITLYLFQTESNKRSIFFVDQFLHLVSIYLIWLLYKGNELPLNIFQEEKALLLITLVLFLSIPASILVKIFIAKWSPTDDKQYDSLQDTGKYIGILERLFVFFFVVNNHWEATGFLIAANSVFRFGDIKESNDRKLTEYILIGTFLSFGLAMFSGFLYSTALIN